jgi:hypothetical protein
MLYRLIPNWILSHSNPSDGDGQKQTTPGNRLTVGARPGSNAAIRPEMKSRETAGDGITTPSAGTGVRNEIPLGGLFPLPEKPSGISPFWLLLVLPMIGLVFWLWHRRGNRGEPSGKGSGDWRVLAARYLRLYIPFYPTLPRGI